MIGIMINNQANTPMMEKVAFKLKGFRNLQKDENLFISLDFPVQCLKC